MNGLTLKSHTAEEIMEAIHNGVPVYALDTGNDGADDTLIGMHDEVVADLLYYHELDALPHHWSLTRVTWLSQEIDPTKGGKRP